MIEIHIPVRIIPNFFQQPMSNCYNGYLVNNNNNNNYNNNSLCSGLSNSAARQRNIRSKFVALLRRFVFLAPPNSIQWNRDQGRTKKLDVEGGRGGGGAYRDFAYQIQICVASLHGYKHV